MGPCRHGAGRVVTAIGLGDKVGSSGSLCELLDSAYSPVDPKAIQRDYSHGDIACKLEDKQLTSTLRPLKDGSHRCLRKMRKNAQSNSWRCFTRPEPRVTHGTILHENRPESLMAFFYATSKGHKILPQSGLERYLGRFYAI